DVVLSRVVPAAIGMASLGGLLFPGAGDGCSGAHITIGDADQPRSVLAPLAPGLMRQVPIEQASLIEPGDTVSLSAGPCVIALDGEREFEVLDADARIEVRFNPIGPRVVDIGAAIQAAAMSQFFTADIPSART